MLSDVEKYYKNKKVSIQSRGIITTVTPDQFTSTPGIYKIFQVHPMKTYRIVLDYKRFKGNIRLWISDMNNKPLLFNPQFFLKNRTEILETSYFAKCAHTIKIGLLFVDPQKDQYFEIVKIKIQECNKPTSIKTLAIIVPYRNRFEHLKRFVPEMRNYLTKFNFQIFVIHQKNKKLFNRAALFNIGYHLIRQQFDYFCFHDIDLIPEGSDYSFPKSPCHLSMNCSQFNYKKKKIFGGVVLFTGSQFTTINGFSNLYKGWGGEDDDLLLRVKKHYTPKYRPGKYLSLNHTHIGKSGNPNYKNNLNMYMKRKNNIKHAKDDGLNAINKTFKYKVLKINKINTTIMNNSRSSKIDFVGCKNMTYQNGLDYMIDIDFI
jgi:hypothetical protein